MKPYLLKRGRKGCALLVLSITLFACGGGVKMPGERNKMPRFDESLSYQEEQSVGRTSYTACGMAFETELVSLNAGVDSRSYYCIPLPAEADSSAIALLNMFKPLASMYMAEWVKMNSQGIMLDLRSNRQQPGTRTNYKLERDQSVSIPVALLWDAASASRVQNFEQLMSTIPNVNSIKTTNSY